MLASAGNYGSQPYLTGSPASGAGVISVAASNPMENYPGAQLTVDGKSVQAMNANDIRATSLTCRTFTRSLWHDSGAGAQ